MKRTLMLVLGITMMTVGTTWASPDTDQLTAPARSASQATWTAFSSQLVDALQGDHAGMQQGALQHVIQYRDYVSVDAAAFDIVRIYRNHEDDNMRRMAVVALGAMENRWAMDYLKRAERFEKSEAVKATIQAVLTQYRRAA
ncbi:MAG: hypothetical protein AAGJ10_02555 [Bacteroidota bacterium]